MTVETLYMAIDPGKSVGVASFNDEGKELKRGVFSEENFLQFLQGLLGIRDYKDKKIVFIVEPFNLRENKALVQTGSDMPASRMIGAIQLADKILGDQSKIVYQPPSILSTALKWAGLHQYVTKLGHASKHVPDQHAAYAHGVYYLIKNDILKHPVLED